MKKSISTFIATTVVATSTFAGQMAFDFKDPKGVNNATFNLDAPLEAISGSANGVSGTVHFDPSTPDATKGKIIIDAKSLHVGNPMMKEHLHGEQWLNTSKYGEITFETKSMSKVKQDGVNVTAHVTGIMTILGKSKELTVPVRFTYLKDKLGARTNGRMQGDLLVIRADFNIQRADFGINPSAPTDKVAETIELKLSVAGAAPKA